MENKNIEKIKMKNKTQKIISVLVIIFLTALQLSAQSLGNIFKGYGNNSKELSELSLISVTIGGDYLVQGTFPASSTETVDQFITRVTADYRDGAIRFARDEESLIRINSQVDAFSKRNITLKRLNGEEVKVDLQMFRVTGNFKFNPYLKNGDVIIFPKLDLDRNFISIAGAVNKPDKFPYSEGDKLEDAIKLAQGINSAYAGVEDAEISRLSADGETEELLKFKISDNPLLKRGDRITIIANENQKKDYKVLVLGEVNRPGYIFVTKNSTTIRDVIHKAGGLRKDALLSSAKIIRGTSVMETLRLEALKERFKRGDKKIKAETKINFERFEYYAMARMSDIVLEDSIYFIIDNKLRMMESSASVDFTKIYDDNYKDGEFKVKDGDVIIIPEQTNTVYVFGQVNAPGYVEYKPEFTVEDYVKLAGGLGEDYDDDIKIIKAKDRSWNNVSDSVKIEPGDFIYVPKSPTKPLGYYLQNASFITAIASALTTIAVLIITNFIKKN